MLPRTAAQVLMPPDGAFKTHTSLRETLNQADLDLPYFRTTEQNSPGLMQFANRNPPEPPYTRKLMSPTNQHLLDSSLNSAEMEIIMTEKIPVSKRLSENIAQMEQF